MTRKPPAPPPTKYGPSALVQSRLASVPGLMRPGSTIQTIQRMQAPTGLGTPTPPAATAATMANGGGPATTVALVAPPPTASTVTIVVPTPPALSARLATWRQRATTHFQNKTFTVDEFCAFVLGYKVINARAGALNLLGELRRAGVLFPPVQEPVRDGLVLSMDASKASQAPPPAAASGVTNRQAFGMTNPAHNAVSMVPFWAAHANTPPPPGRDDREHYMSPSRHYRIGDNNGNPLLDSKGAQVMAQGHKGLVMGHLPSASTYVNTTGHMHSPGTNRQHNTSPSAYGQVETAAASAASGSKEPRYTSPSPTRGSWPGYYDSSNKRFKSEYRKLWPTHIRRRCAKCNHNGDLESVKTCSQCGAPY